MDDINAKLVIISQIQPGDKLAIDVGGFPIIMPESTFRPLIRFYNGDGRTGTVNYINKLVESAMTIILSDMNNDSLLYELLSAKVGIYNLMRTYMNDAKTTQKLEQIVMNIFFALEMQKP